MSFAFGSSGYLAFAVPCMLMMGAMVWIDTGNDCPRFGVRRTVVEPSLRGGGS